MDSAVFYAACSEHVQRHALFGQVVDEADGLVVATGHPCNGDRPSWAVYDIDSGESLEFAGSLEDALVAAAKHKR